jgi:predicted transcriptional regulator
VETQNRRRSRLEVFAEILNLSRKSQTKTCIMHKTNLSYSMLQDCLKELQDLKFIEVHHSIEKYSTTEKGLEFLQKFTDLQELISVSSFDGCVQFSMHYR